MNLGDRCPHCNEIMARSTTAYVYGRIVICKRAYLARRLARRGIVVGMPRPTRLKKTARKPATDALGFPKQLPCLVCGRARKSTWPGDRIHPQCRRARAGIALAEFTDHHQEA